MSPVPFFFKKKGIAAESKSVLCLALVAGFWEKQILTEEGVIASSLKATHFPEYKRGQTGQHNKHWGKEETQTAL